MTRTQRHLAAFAIPIALALAIALRLAWRDYVSADMSSALLGWYDYLALSPGIEALRARISTYSPPYLYILAASVHLRETLWPELSRVMAVKLPSLLMDVGAAVAVGVAVRQLRSAPVAMLAGLLTLFLPTVWLNSGVWGQCDVFYATAVLVALIFGARKQYTRALFCFGIAAAFKAQALFAGPFVLYLLLKREIGVKALAAAVLGFVLSMLPAWWVGAPARSTFLIYASQADEFMSLSLLAPNLYGLISDTYLDYGTTVGLAVTAVLCVLMAVFASALSPRVTPVTLIAVAAFAATLAPFTLPRMHERYFYLAELLLLVLAFYRPKLFWAPLLVQLASTNAYLEYFDLTTPGVLPAHLASSTTGGWLVLAVLIGLTAVAARARWPQLTTQHKHRLRIGSAVAGALMALSLGGVVLAAPAFEQPHRAMSLSDGARVRDPISIMHGDTLEVIGISHIEDNWLRGRSYTLRVLTRALKPTGKNYTLRLDLYDQQGRSLQIAVDATPELPTSQWVSGRVFAQNVLVPVWPLTPAPTLTLLKVSWIDPDTDAALDTHCDGQPCDGRLPGPPVELNKDDTRPFDGAPLAQFDDDLALARAALPNATLAAGQTLTVSLVWQALRQQPGAVTEFVHVVDAGGALVAQSDGPPNDGRFPPQLLRNRQFMPSVKVIALPATLQPGHYRVRVGLYRPDSLARLPAQSGGAALPDDLVDVGFVDLQ